jgi:flagellar biosynthesis chaperone FliJ
VAASKSLRRLRDIRQAEEEQNKAAMESAVAELQRLETALSESRKRVMRARVLVTESVQAGELLDRISGLEEIRTAESMAKILAGKFAAAGNNVQKKRQEFIEKRIERRQAETVYDALRARDTVEVNRKSQLALDDWHRSRRNRITREAGAAHPESDIPLTR